MNWQKYYETFDEVDPANVALFATPREIKEAVDAYNKALLKLQQDKAHSKQALQAMQAIAKDYPMFPQAMHIRAIAKADAGDLQGALDLLKKIRLLDIDEKQAALIKEQIFIAEKEIINLKKQEKSGAKIKNNKQDKKKIDVTDILLKTSKRGRPHQLSREEINALNRKLGNENPLDLSGEIAYEEKRATLRFTLIVILIAMLAFSIFYYGVRPAILKATGNDVQHIQQLHWLEKEISKRAEDDAEIKDLLNDYYAAFQTEEKQNDQSGAPLNSDKIDSTVSEHAVTEEQSTAEQLNEAEQQSTTESVAHN